MNKQTIDQISSFAHFVRENWSSKIDDILRSQDRATNTDQVINFYLPLIKLQPGPECRMGVSDKEVRFEYRSTPGEIYDIGSLAVGGPQEKVSLKDISNKYEPVTREITRILIDHDFMNEIKKIDANDVNLRSTLEYLIIKIPLSPDGRFACKTLRAANGKFCVAQGENAIKEAFFGESPEHGSDIVEEVF